MAKSTETVRFGSATVFPPRPGAAVNAAHLSGTISLTEADRDALISHLQSLEFVHDEYSKQDVATIDIALWKRYSQIDGSFNRMIGHLEPSLTEAQRQSYRQSKQRNAAPAQDY